MNLKTLSNLLDELGGHGLAARCALGNERLVLFGLFASHAVDYLSAGALLNLGVSCNGQPTAGREPRPLVSVFAALNSRRP